MQHPNSNCTERDVENETKTEDLLLRYTEGIHVLEVVLIVLLPYYAVWSISIIPEISKYKIGELSWNHLPGLRRQPGSMLT